MAEYDLALIPCTSGKNPSGITPATLYRGAIFSTMMRHAQQRSARILILSAKFGLLELDAPVSWYDRYLPNLTPQERVRLVVRLEQQMLFDKVWLQGRIISYLPKAYYDVVNEAAPAVAERLRRPYKTLPMLTLTKVLSNEIAGYGKYPARR